MNRILGATLLVLVAAQTVAAGQAKPNTLTPQEVADGCILLFDGETTFGWKIDGEARVENGALVLGGVKATKAETTTALLWNCSFELETKWQGDQPPELSLAGFIDRYSLDETSKGKFVAQKVFSVRQVPLCPPQPQRFDVPAGTKLAVRSIKYRPLDLQPIFNGKNLTGWRKYEADEKRARSRFTVTAEGWLTVKDGPGDLQTAGQWDDFVLQLECRTNGTNLNSGVFFRCQPNQYQQGYEAQIHNRFDVAPDREYAVDEFDARTNTKTGVTKVKSPAADYGSGAIYRRIPARRQVARDQEWFTMTVVAQGRHIATWVNGIQQVDWTDHRPLNDNPRNGCRLEKGPISLQGHDPTTDLSFRNVRITALPRPAAKE